MGELQRLPAVHRLLAHPALQKAHARWGWEVVREAARHVLAASRAHIRQGLAAPSLAELVKAVLDHLQSQLPAAYPAVINATGVLIHTNLGRAPRLQASPSPYLALEMDLAEGRRGERLAPVVARLKKYFGCEAATVVTNNAAALLLLLAAHARGREVLVSRGELIEIGGSFRLPEIMAQAGVQLVEVGCTNRTHLRDYQQALTPNTAAILQVHRSNFQLSGFVSSPGAAELAALARTSGVQFWVDQGSGCHRDLRPYGLEPEPTVQELLAAGAQAVLFSGDKLLGGPQAGVIVGAEAVIAPLKHHPLRRALRPDKGVLVALTATLDAFLAGRWEEVPLYRLLSQKPGELAQRAKRLARQLRRVGVPAAALPSSAVLGGGTAPGQTLPSWAVQLPGEETLARALRLGTPAVVPRWDNGQLLLDLRAVFPEEDRVLAAAVGAAWEKLTSTQSE